jgi:hypothetical protein
MEIGVRVKASGSKGQDQRVRIKGSGSKVIQQGSGSVGFREA